MKLGYTKLCLLAVHLLVGAVSAYSNENWPQFKYDCRHSGMDFVTDLIVFCFTCREIST